MLTHLKIYFETISRKNSKAKEKTTSIKLLHHTHHAPYTKSGKM